MERINGIEIAKKIIEGLKLKPTPKKILAAVLVGEDGSARASTELSRTSSPQVQSSISFLKQKERAAKELGVDFRLYKFDASLKNDDLRREIGKIAKLSRVGGIIVQLPLPRHINRRYVLNAIPVKKDIDVLSEKAQAEFQSGKSKILPPAVGVVEEILKVIQNYRTASEHSKSHPNNKIIEKDLSYKLNALFFKIHDELGRHCTEKQYGDALEKFLKLESISYKREQGVSVSGRLSNFLDFNIENKIIVDLKSKPFTTADDYFQMKRYLEAANLELGIIVNFRSKYLSPKRVLNSNFRLGPDRVRDHSGRSDKFVGWDDLRVAIVGAGFLVGKPISEWLKARCKELKIFEEGANLNELRNYDLVISGVGKAGLIKPEMLKDGASAIDFGYDMADGKIRGDLETNQPANYPTKKLIYTPTPGGTGPILVAKLMENFYRLNPIS